MTSLIRELQEECLDDKIDTSSLLRKALLVAKKLKIQDIENWLQSEINGYQEDSKIPDYRVLRGQVKMRNPVNGINMPVIFENESEERFASFMPNGQSVSELEEILSKMDAKSGLTMELPHFLTAAIMKAGHRMSKPYLHIQSSQLKGITSVVRTRLMEWAITMEENGVLGEGIVFSEKEKRAASTVVYNIGTMSNSQIQHGNKGSTQSFSSNEFDTQAIAALLTSIEVSIKNLGIPSEIQNDIMNDMTTIRAQIGKGTPSQNIITESLKSLKAIFENGLGGAVGTGIVAGISKFLI
jgi:hypothetical protein